MTTEDNKRKLDDLIRRKDTLQSKAQRAQGRLDSAKTELAAVADECRKKGVEPNQLSEAITKLQDKFDTLAADVAQRVEVAEKAIAPYLEER